MAFLLILLYDVVKLVCNFFRLAHQSKGLWIIIISTVVFAVIITIALILTIYLLPKQVCVSSNPVWTHLPQITQLCGLCCVVCLFVGCLMPQQHASVPWGRISSDNFTCCYTEIEVADPTFYLTPSQYTDTGPTSLSADPIISGAWHGSLWYDLTRKNPVASRIWTPDFPFPKRTP